MSMATRGAGDGSVRTVELTALIPDSEELSERY